MVDRVEASILNTHPKGVIADGSVPSRSGFLWRAHDPFWVIGRAMEIEMNDKLIATPLNDIQETLAVLAKYGVTPEDFKSARRSPMVAARVAAAFRGVTDYDRYHEPRSVLGEYFVSPEDITAQVGSVRYDPRELRAYYETLPLGKTLQWLKDQDAILMAAPPGSASWLEIYQMFPGLCHYYGKLDYSSEWMRVLSIGGWFAIRKGLLMNTTGRTACEQRRVIELPQQMPDVVQLTWAACVWQILRGRPLIEYQSRTAQTDGKSSSVIVDTGPSSPGAAPRVHVGLVADNESSAFLGVSPTFELPSA